MNRKKTEQRFRHIGQDYGGTVSASITLYLAMTLVIILVLLCTLIESGRVHAMQARVKSAVYMGMDSVFSEYALPVFEDYGVMMLWCTEEAFAKRFEGYVTRSLDNAGSSVLPAANLMQTGFQSAVLTDARKVTDENGKPFEEQVYEYMKYYLAEEAAGKLLENADLVGQGRKVQAFMDKVNKHRKVFTAVEKSVGKIKDKIGSVQKMAADPARYIGKISDSLEKFERTEEEAFLTDAYVNENELIAVRYKLSDSFGDIRKETETYHARAEQAEAAVTEIETELALRRPELSDEVFDSLQEELADIRQKSGNETADFYRIEENLSKVEKYQEKVDSLDGLINALDTDITTENAGALKNLADSYRQSFSDFDLSGLSIQYDNEKVQKESSDFLSVINDLFSKGVLAYIVGDISPKKAELADLPSDGKTQEKDSEDLLKAGTRKAVFSEYIRMHFGRFTETKEKHALDYETEYILAGKSSDKENLQIVLNEVILLRTGCNLISLLKDPEKKAEALALATAIVGFTGMPVLIKIMQLLILNAWALAESIVDARVLFNGEKVPLIKRSDEWSLSLTSVKNFTASAIEGQGSKNGTSYEDYLRMLLLAQNKQTQILRAMDMIQLNMVRNENADFRMKDCIVSVELDADFEAAPLFVTFPFVRRYVGFENGRYGFCVTQAYAY